MSGEEAHKAGEEGARRAKLWLDGTTRADARWINPQKHAVGKLSFAWANPAKPNFSFDLGGLMMGDDFDGQEFVAESKYYNSSQSDLGVLYREFLAKCYCALKYRPDRCDHFFFITWHPFSVTDWSKLTTEPYIRTQVIEHRQNALNEQDKTKAEGLVDDTMVRGVGERLWLIVLSDKQETLSISRNDRALLMAERIRSGQ